MRFCDARIVACNRGPAYSSLMVRRYSAATSQKARESFAARIVRIRASSCPRMRGVGLVAARADAMPLSRPSSS
ncbi:hypothetical protein A5702_24710 [Mycobacterium sp. E3339]|nr:hypothetical protein A5702_24710 [Mycobacterium sp. E3339]